MLKLNAALNVIGQIFYVGLAVATVPIYTAYFGIERYGSYLFLVPILSYYTFADPALLRVVSNLKSRSSPLPELEKHLSSTCWAGFIFSSLMAILFFLMYPWVAGELAIDSQIVSEVSDARIAAALLVIATTLSSLQIGHLEGRKAFAKSNVTQIGGGIFTMLIPIMPAIYDGTFSRLIMGVLIGRVMQLFIGIILDKFHIASPPSLTSLYQMKKTWKELGWLSLSSGGAILSSTVDRLILGVTLGPSQLYFYSIPTSLAARFVVISGSLARATSPYMSSREENDANRLAKSANEFVFIFITLVALFLSAIAHDILEMWINEEFANKSTLIFRIATLGLFGLSIAQVPALFLQSTNRSSKIVLIQSFEIVPYVFLIFLSSNYGIIAIAIAAQFRNVVIGIAHLFAAGFNSHICKALLLVAAQASAIVSFEYLDSRDVLDRILFTSFICLGMLILLIVLFTESFAKMLRMMKVGNLRAIYKIRH